MSFWSTIKRWFGSGEGCGRVYLVDATALAPGGGRDRFSPRVQLDLLQRLARFAKQENIQVHVGIPGEPLRQAPDRKPFREVMVHYTENGESSVALLANLARKLARRHDVVVVTDHVELEEQVVSGGGKTLRGNTFRKAFDGSSGGGDERPAGASRARRRRRFPRRSNRPAEERRTVERGESKETDPIREMIDLVE